VGVGQLAAYLCRLAGWVGKRVLVVRGSVVRWLRPVRGAWLAVCRVAHRWRYVPLAGVFLGGLLILVAPGPRGIPGDVLSDDSMAPSISVGEALGVDRGAFLRRLPRVGEVVTFHPPVGEACSSVPAPGAGCATVARADAVGEGIKRIVAGPGATVAILDGRLLRNGRVVFEAYDQRPCVTRTLCQMPVAVRVPPGTWWVLADNRNAPNDSRTYGPIPTAWITGLVALPSSTARRFEP
jgi:signal peptidase I